MGKANPLFVGLKRSVSYSLTQMVKYELKSRNNVLPTQPKDKYHIPLKIASYNQPKQL